MRAGQEAQCLVIAKAPVAGLAKTRLGAEIGMAAAADLAAAALLDTLDACRAAFASDCCHLALTGDLGSAGRADEIAAALSGWSVFGQVGESFGGRLAAAHAEVGRRTSAPTVQIGMDTPQVTGSALREVADGLDDHDALLGPAEDGGWWVLAVRDAGAAARPRGRSHLDSRHRRPHARRAARSWADGRHPTRTARRGHRGGRPRRRVRRTERSLRGRLVALGGRP